jgi:hypothetical protein
MVVTFATFPVVQRFSAGCYIQHARSFYNINICNQAIEFSEVGLNVSHTD